ncbi:unnamed protein product [Dicrocoelium dendriticum]|nr:unnamed protein product [Dicrocoelium dendriticum]
MDYSTFIILTIFATASNFFIDIMDSEHEDSGGECSFEEDANNPATDIENVEPADIGDIEDENLAVDVSVADRKDEDSTTGLQKPSRFPLSRVKAIAKIVPSVNLINTEALLLIERACERFVREFCNDIHRVTLETGKKTVSRLNVDTVVRHMSQYEFLDGMLD